MMDNEYYDYVDEDTWICYGSCEDCPHKYKCKDSLDRTIKKDS